MKIKPNIYAQVLIESTDESNLKMVANNFWHKLQKNGQYKDLPKIIDALDLEYAKSKDMLLAKVYSEENLLGDQLKSIEEKLEKDFKKKVILKNILKEKLSGIVIKIDDCEINMSLEGKINKLKTVLNNN
jgi:F0F1-type ATP synthase delta subunit